jgi:hypothetical protein
MPFTQVDVLSVWRVFVCITAVETIMPLPSVFLVEEIHWLDAMCCLVARPLGDDTLIKAWKWGCREAHVFVRCLSCSHTKDYFLQ